jgi:fructose-bisphosphate aldolase, class II
MAHVPISTILYDARRRNYGAATLWGGNLEKVVGYVRAAESTRSPFIMCYNRGLCPDIPLEINMPLLVKAAEYADVPAATILDHATDLATIKTAIDCGAASVMFDGSMHPYEENVEKTAEVVSYAHSHGVDVEAELGAVGGDAEELEGSYDVQSTETDPNQVVDFVKRTGIDAIALSFGNSHGKYQGPPRLNYDLVSTIASTVDIPLVMHGASGLSIREYRRAIESGISKLNYYTALGLSSGDNLRRRILTSDEDPVCHKIVKWNIDFVTQEMTDLFRILNAAGKADDMTGRGPAGSGQDFESMVELLADRVVEKIRREMP